MSPSCNLDYLWGPVPRWEDGVSPLKKHDTLGCVLWVVMLGLGRYVLALLDPALESGTHPGCVLDMPNGFTHGGDALHDLGDRGGVQGNNLGSGLHGQGHALDGDQVNRTDCAQILGGEKGDEPFRLVKLYANLGYSKILYFFLNSTLPE